MSTQLYNVFSFQTYRNNKHAEYMEGVLIILVFFTPLWSISCDHKLMLFLYILFL